MKKLIDRIDGYLDEELSGITISNPRKAEEIRKYTIRPILLKQELVFQVAGYTKTQVFHENLKAHEVSDWLADHLPGYKQVQVRHGLETHVDALPLEGALITLPRSHRVLRFRSRFGYVCFRHVCSRFVCFDCVCRFS